MKIYLCHSEADRQDAEIFAAYFAPYVSLGSVELVSSSSVTPGQDFKDEFALNLGLVDSVILFLTKDFLSDPKIQDWQLPLVFKNAKARSLKVIPILWRACVWEAVAALSSMGPVPQNGRALCSLSRRHREEEICKIISVIAASPMGAIPRPALSSTQQNDLAASTGEMIRQKTGLSASLGWNFALFIFIFLLVLINFTILLPGNRHKPATDAPAGSPINNTINNQPTINITNKSSLKPGIEPRIENNAKPENNVAVHNEPTIVVNVIPSAPSSVPEPPKDHSITQMDSTPHNTSPQLDVKKSSSSASNTKREILFLSYGLPSFVVGLFIGFLPTYCYFVLNRPKGPDGQF